MKKLILLTALFIGSISFLVAQTAEDALRYSRITFGGTARSMAMAGAFGALGADFSTLSTNPAGIGVYNKSIVSFTPSVYTGKTVSEFMGETASDNKYNFNFGNAGFVLVSGSRENSLFRNFQFGFGMNRTQNFNNRIITEGFNTQSSIRQTWTDFANRDGYLNPFDTELAVNSGLIFLNGDTVNPVYLNDKTHGLQEGYVYQRKNVVTEGAMNEMVFSAGTNIGDILYVGATIGLPYLKYNSYSTFTEADVRDSIPYFSSLEFSEKLRTTGSGFNFKLGFILKPVYWLRIGGALHTPTFYNDMYDEWSSEVYSYFDKNQHEVDDSYASSPDGYYSYSLETPMRLLGSVAIVIGKYGLISADYEYVDYSSAKLRSDEDDFYSVNKTISSDYVAGHNLHFGTEWVLGQVRVRGGYAVYGSPYKNQLNNGGVRDYYSFGVGVRDQHFFADLGFVFSQSERDYYIYSSEYVAAATNTFTSNQALLTLGFRF
ncbi:MAG: hypothetical protein PHU97_05985 [Bacteroidales bacterium]|nr:hypothetical protein [Bacteroidales bacterium]MDY0286185.1 hypothetical protein [Bacteroidales bacterium]HPE86432.1 hypothetical protein [Bacteroidales bacterium]